jgi:hypothetical protein
MQKAFNKLFMDYITRLELNDIAICTYKQRAFVLTDDDLRKIIHVNKLAVGDERYRAKRIVSDALCFIYGWCHDEAHRGLINQQYNNWQHFFDVCLADIAAQQSDDVVGATFEMQKALENYRGLFSSYVCLYSKTCDSKELLTQLAILMLLATLY